MKIKDYISKTIQEYPSLFKDVDYEKSKLKVLDHIFFVNGNGLDFAKTENPSEGGYLIEPNYKYVKDSDDYIRLKDKPYGKLKYKPIPEDYFESDVYYIQTFKKPLDVIIKTPHNIDDNYYRFPKDIEERQLPKWYKAESHSPFIPYSISKGYCKAADIYYKNIFLQPDWMEELLILCRVTLGYYNDETQYVTSYHYPNEQQIQHDIKHFQLTFDKEGLKGLNKLQALWGFKVKQTVPDYDEVKEHRTKSWVKFRKEQIKFLKLFIERFEREKHGIN